MHVLVTGANGYIGLRLIQALLDAGHEITAVIRDRRRFPANNFSNNATRLHLVEADFLDAPSLRHLPAAVDAAYCLIHSMGSGGDFARMEEQCAKHCWVGCQEFAFEMKAPERAIEPDRRAGKWGLVRDFDLINDSGRIVHSVRDHRGASHEWRPEEPLLTKRLTLRILATHGASAAVFRVRVF